MTLSLSQPSLADQALSNAMGEYDGSECWFLLASWESWAVLHDGYLEEVAAHPWFAKKSLGFL